MIMRKLHGVLDGKINEVRTRIEKWAFPEPNTGCWLWSGVVGQSGYGSVSISKIKYQAHRISYLLYNGIDPGNSLVLHKCDVRICVNPDHLFLGDHFDNMADMVAKKRHWTTFGEFRPNSKLTENDVIEIRSLYNQGIRCYILAKRYGVLASTVKAIVDRKRWKHVK